ncbi:MAG TPA: universal stress protein [Pseudoxanthomonas sp.]|nr:universal stress protein [Pseudoxanthomonas sp.]
MAVDGSAVAAKAIRRVAKLAKDLKDAPQVSLLHVVPRLSRAAEKEFGQAGPGRYYEGQSEAVLRTLRPLLGRTGLAFEERKAIGDPAPTILAEAKAAKADMVVIGSHGKGALQSLLIGSVALKVVASSPLPVLVVH